MKQQITKNVRRAFAAGVILSACSAAHAGEIGPRLINLIENAGVTELFEVVVTYNDSQMPAAERIALLDVLGIDTGYAFESLPISGALATGPQILALAASTDIYSVYFNAPLEYYNQEAREISGVARAQANQADFGLSVPYSGQGVTAVVHDSGIDATHADLSFGDHVVENVQGLTNLQAYSEMLPVTYIEGQPNTDLNSGHGTHVAGIFGGNGARSNGLYAGAAPGADIVGYGSGGAIAILDAIGGFDYAITHQFVFETPIRLITNSWGSSGDFDHEDPVNVASYEAFKRGISVLFAAGNSGSGEDTNNPYAQAPWVIGVAAMNKSGQLADFSSRGLRGETGDFTTPDGVEWTYINEPTIGATGVDVISVRAVTNGVSNGGDADLEAIAPEHLPFYTMISGTSMSTPHVAGIVALMYEANPALTPLQVKEILQVTATNMPGREAWEAGAGHVNAYAALAMASGLRTDYGETVNSLREFNASADLVDGGSMDYSLFFTPIGESDSATFEVGNNTALVSARAVISDNAVAIRLIDPDGESFGSAIALPVLGETVGVSAPGKAGTWTLTVGGVGSISGIGLDAVGVTNGLGLPGFVDATVSLLDINGFTGLNDIAGHPAENIIQAAVQRRLVDGLPGNVFRPNNDLTRAQLAEYLTMAAAVRQELPLDGGASFSDVGLNNARYAFVEAAAAPGGALRDRDGSDGAVILSNGSNFNPGGSVDRTDLAYSLGQALGMEDELSGFSGDIVAEFDGNQYVIEDQDQVDPAMRGYVQLAIAANLMRVRFELEQAPFIPFPTLRAYFDPVDDVSRAEYAFSAIRFVDTYVQ